MAVVISSTSAGKPKHDIDHPCPPGSLRWWIGFLMASVFTVVYFLAPAYILLSLWALSTRQPYSVWFAFPMLLSAALPPISSPWMLRQLKPMVDYFKYEQIIETSPVDVRDSMRTKGKKFILGVQPHGVLSLCGMCSAVVADSDLCGRIPTGVASALMYTPILKHVMGIFGLISASKPSLQRQLRIGDGITGTIVLYVGGMAELFLSSVEEETLYLKKRKGFIKLALQEGIDVVPIYLFGNTTVLSVVKTGILADLSRKLQVSLTYFWGKWYLPLPRDEKLLYVAGQPLGLPHIAKPTQEDVDKWHEKYCSEVTRLFDTYKERVPAYKHKKLVIV